MRVTAFLAVCACVASCVDLTPPGSLVGDFTDRRDGSSRTELDARFAGDTNASTSGPDAASSTSPDAAVSPDGATDTAVLPDVTRDIVDGLAGGDAVVVADAPVGADTGSRDAGVPDSPPPDLVADERIEDVRPEVPQPDASPPRTLFTTQVPDPMPAMDMPFELGLRFKSTVAGDVVGIRYWRVVGDQGPHVGHLWAVDGSLLATVSFDNESASGWQEARLAQPVAITAGQIYVTSVNTLKVFAVAFQSLVPPVTNGPLTSIDEAGVHGGVAMFPAAMNLNFKPHYFRDILFVAR
jgi:hypothetical protein